MKVPRLSLPQADAEVLESICAEVQEVILSGRFIGGPQVEALELELSEYFDRPVVTVGSGTDALTAALMALPFCPSRVLVPAFSFSATASAVLRAGLFPMFVDIDPTTYTIDWEQVRALDGYDAVVIPVHLYGHVCAIPADLKATVLEDACQSFGGTDVLGRRAGAIGPLGALSFFPSKPLGCYGDGGAVVCGDEDLADRVRRVARHGARGNYISEVPGFNSRLDAMQAAVLRVKLPHVGAQRQARLRIAEQYIEELSGVGGITVPNRWARSAWSCFVVRVLGGCRDAVLGRLQGQGIDAVVQYPVPLHLQPAFSGFGSPHAPEAELAAQEVLGLPIWAGMTEDQVHAVVTALKAAVRGES